MTQFRRSASKLLEYVRQSFTDGFVGEVLYDVWVDTEYGEAVAGDAFVALEMAAKSLSGRRSRHDMCSYQANNPDKVDSLLKEAINILET